MIKIYVHRSFSDKHKSIIMVIDDDMVLYSNSVDLGETKEAIDQLVYDFSDTDRPVKVFSQWQ